MTTLRFEQKPEVAMSQAGLSITSGGSGTTGARLNRANTGSRSVGSAVASGTTIEGRRLSEPGAPSKNFGVRIGKGETRRFTIYAFDPSASQHVCVATCVILVKESVVGPFCTTAVAALWRGGRPLSGGG